MEEKFPFPTLEYLTILNNIGLTYGEMCDKFQTHETPESIKYYFKRLRLKHKFRSDIIDEYLERFPFVSTKILAEKFGVSTRLVNMVKSKKPIRTRIECIRNEFDFECTISGHSGYAEYGKDIVCASISSVVYYVVNTLNELLPSMKCSQKEGYVNFYCPIVDDTTEIILNNLCNYFKELESQYPNNVQVWLTKSY